MEHPSYDEGEEGEDQAEDKNTPILDKGKNPGEENQGYEEIHEGSEVCETFQKRPEDKPQNDRNEEEKKSPNRNLEDRDMKLIGHNA